MGETMNKFRKYTNKCDFDGLYRELAAEHYDYTLENFTRDFNKISSEKKFAYLHYLIANEETPELHLLVCDFLLYTDTFFFDIYPVVKWHLKRALEISPNSVEVLGWIIGIFANGNPDSPFSGEELRAYNERLNELEQA